MNYNNEKYYISEIFESIQGEGNYSGARCLFIRFQFCNLSCSWCDTKYTWSNKSEDYKVFSEQELKDIIQKSPSYHIVFTGGEPLLYKIDNLIVDGKKFHVETNCCFIPDKPVHIVLKNGLEISRKALEFNKYREFNWVVSPKLSNSGEEINSENLSYWAKQDFCIFKFIIKSIGDINEIETIRNKFQIPIEKVYVGLEGTTRESQLKPELVEEIIKRGFSYSPRLHVLLWGNQRKK